MKLSRNVGPLLASDGTGHGRRAAGQLSQPKCRELVCCCRAMTLAQTNRSGFCCRRQDGYLLSPLAAAGAGLPSLSTVAWVALETNYRRDTDVRSQPIWHKALVYRLPSFTHVVRLRLSITLSAQTRQSYDGGSTDEMSFAGSVIGPGICPGCASARRCRYSRAQRSSECSALLRACTGQIAPAAFASSRRIGPSKISSADRQEEIRWPNHRIWFRCHYSDFGPAH